MNLHDEIVHTIQLCPWAKHRIYWEYTEKLLSQIQSFVSVVWSDSEVLASWVVLHNLLSVNVYVLLRWWGFPWTSYPWFERSDLNKNITHAFSKSLGYLSLFSPGEKHTQAQTHTLIHTHSCILTQIFLSIFSLLYIFRSDSATMRSCWLWLLRFVKLNPSHYSLIQSARRKDDLSSFHIPGH